MIVVAMIILMFGAPVGAPAPTGIAPQALYVTAPVTLDGQDLFTIAAPAVPGPGQTGIGAREAAVESALTQIVAQTTTATGTETTVYNPYTLRVVRAPSGDQFVLQVVDATHRTPATILTVTPVDAKYHSMTPEALSLSWQGVLQRALHYALLKRQPAVEHRNVNRAAIAGGALTVFTLFVWAAVIMPLGRRIRRLERRMKQRGEELEQAQSMPAADHAATGERRRNFLALALRASDPRRRTSVYRSLSAALIWILVLLWFGALVWGFLLFPQTTPLAHEVVRSLLAIAAVWIAAGLLNRILDVSIGRLGQVWRERQYRSSEERARDLLRIPTITSAMAGSKAFVIFFVALLVSLSELSVPVWSVVTFGGLTAIGITLAAQNFVRDFVNGFLVLFEDQYVVGDYITINSQSGIVENLTLRMAQLRDLGGNLITIPHSTVTSVVNHSRNWSRVDYRVSVDPGTDVERALQILRAAIADVAHEDRWRGVVLEPVEWMGVEGLSRDGIILRASMKTAPLRQFDVRRALNESVHRRFKEAGIGLGAPVPETQY